MNKDTTLRLTMTALMAALCFIAFTFFKISIPLPTGNTAFHLGNTFLVLAALLLGGLIGGLAGAIGMSIADIMDPRYVLSAPKTIILKLMIGLITGFFAHRVFKIKDLQGKELTLKVALSASAGMLFNVVFEPLFGYFYYQYILKMAEKAASTLAKFNALATLTNAALAVIIATILYLALNKRFKNNDLIKRLAPKN